MNKPRYAIVKVECPPKNEIDAQFVCYPNDNNCGGCRYGDTKEQLITKVEQAIRKPIHEGNLDFSSKGFRYGVKRLAKEIVEFLGVVK